MAATARSSLFALLLVAITAAPSPADQSADVRDVLLRVATALTDENPAEAMKQFDPSFRQCDRLRDYFDALTASYQITNEVNVTDEQDSPDEAKATVEWVITLGDIGNPGVLETRNRSIAVHFVRQKKHWKIVDFSPIDLFNPRFHPRSENPPR